MTPKEKARELMDKMLIDFIDWTYHIPINMNDNHTIFSEAKERALIAIEFAREFITGDLNEAFDKTMYLFEVKQEIEKL